MTSQYAVGADFDSTAEEYTEWYSRTDEEGKAIGYDYEVGEYIEDDPTVVNGEFKVTTSEEIAQARAALEDDETTR
ncbi:hypothetical protein [Corynebacterium camporealensis]